MIKTSKATNGLMAMRVAGFGLCGIFMAGHAVYGASKTVVEWRVEAVDYNERVIYHSPETPGFTEWASLWQLPNGRIRCSFLQLTGPKEKPVPTEPVLESKDGGNTWRRVDDNHPADIHANTAGYWQVSQESYLGMAVLADGTLVKPVWPPQDERLSGSVRRSTDGGKSWSKDIFFLPVNKYRTWPTLIRRLRDGRLVLLAGCWKRGDNSCTPHGAWGNMTKMMFVSADKGKTWSKPIILMPTREGSCEEGDFCELPNGDLFWIHRAEHFPDHLTEISPFAARAALTPPVSYYYSDRMQSIVRKAGNTFIPGKAETAPLRHASRPVVIHTQEGIILHLSGEGVDWTADLGKSWQRLNVPGTAYNPQGLQLKDGTIIAIGHSGSDDKYGQSDQAIKQQRYRLKVSKHGRVVPDLPQATAP